MFRLLLTPRWLGYALLAVALAAVMVQLGNWQFSRYEARTAINERIDAGERATPAPVTAVLPRPVAPGAAGPAPPADAAWTPVTATGRYDSANEILVRGRTVERQVGFEVVTPLVLADGSAVLVDRGWIPAPPGAATAVPRVPPAPGGEVSVTGRVHLSESRPRPVQRREGRIEVRRIAVPQLAGELPYPVYNAYVLLTEQRPPADPGFSAIPIQRQNAWLNGGYAVQWWVFAVMTLGAYVWLARREARAPVTTGGNRTGGDRAADRTSHDRAADRTGGDRAGGDRAGEPPSPARPPLPRPSPPARAGADTDGHPATGAHPAAGRHPG